MSEKKRLKELVRKSQHEQLFTVLGEAFSAYPKECNDVITLQQKHQNIHDSKRVGAMTDGEFSAHMAQINRGLLELIDALPDEAAMPTEGKPLQDYHRLTCDRVDQSDRFYELFEAKRQEKVQYYYIYGMEQHAHEGLFQRFAFDLEGKLQDYLNTATLKSNCQALKLPPIPFEESRNEDGYKRNVLKNLFGGLNVTVDDQSPILEKNLADLLVCSPVLKGLSQEDYVCIFLSIHELDWDPDITPLVVNWFITTFCAVDLPETAPTFLFYFGLIYEEDDEEIEQEVQDAILEGGHIQILPELNTVRVRDVKKWLAKYKNNLDLSTDERKAIIAEYFQREDEYYMEDVEQILAQIIIKHNKRFYS